MVPLDVLGNEVIRGALSMKLLRLVHIDLGELLEVTKERKIIPRIDSMRQEDQSAAGFNTLLL